MIDARLEPEDHADTFDHTRGEYMVKFSRYVEQQERIAELEAALDSEHASVGYNIWRFWSDKARDLARRNVEISDQLTTARSNALREAARIADAATHHHPHCDQFCVEGCPTQTNVEAAILALITKDHPNDQYQ